MESFSFCHNVFNSMQLLYFHKLIFHIFHIFVWKSLKSCCRFVLHGKGLIPPFQQGQFYYITSVFNCFYSTTNLDRYGEIILQCPVNITKGIRDQGNVAVLQYICALLNSGGGILHMINIDLKVCIFFKKIMR